MVVRQLTLEQSGTVQASYERSARWLSGSLFCSTETAGCDYLAPIIERKKKV
jgi:hypothetical protein